MITRGEIDVPMATGKPDYSKPGGKRRPALSWPDMANTFLRFLTGFIPAACIILTLWFPCEVQADNAVILTPPSSSVIRSRIPVCHLILKYSSPKAPRIMSTQKNGRDKEIKPIGTWQVRREYFRHYRLPLKPGKNSFEMEPGGQGITITYRPMFSQIDANLQSSSVYLFHRRKVVPKQCANCHGMQEPPNCQSMDKICNLFSPTCYSCHKSVVDKATWKHGPAANWLCRCCHQPTFNSKSVVLPVGKVDILCYRCHLNAKRWKSMAHVHGPVGTGDCTICHNPHGSLHPFHLWADYGDSLCVGCHKDKKQWLVKTKPPKVVHGILTGSGCLACHNPHASANRFQLRKPLKELCTGCHTRFKGVRKGHPVAGHPVEGPRDPLRKGNRFSCTSCHNPHGSKYDHMLIAPSMNAYICMKCHSGGNAVRRSFP